jgi:hypothetical protein
MRRCLQRVDELSHVGLPGADGAEVGDSPVQALRRQRRVPVEAPEGRLNGRTVAGGHEPRVVPVSRAG